MCGGVGGWGGGSKVFAQKARSSGEGISLSHHRRSSGNAADNKFLVGGSNPGRPTFRGGSGGGASYARPGFEPPTEGAAAGCITTRPLLDLRCKASLLLCEASATDKKPKLCVCLLSCLGTDGLTVNLSSRCTAEGNRIFFFIPLAHFVHFAPQHYP